MRALHHPPATLAALGCPPAGCGRPRWRRCGGCTHTDGGFWNNNEGWDPSSDPCRAHAAPCRDVRPEPYEAEAVNATPWWGVMLRPVRRRPQLPRRPRDGALAAQQRARGRPERLERGRRAAQPDGARPLAQRAARHGADGARRDQQPRAAQARLELLTDVRRAGLVNSRGVYQLRELTATTTRSPARCRRCSAPRRAPVPRRLEEPAGGARLRSSASWQRT